MNLDRVGNIKEFKNPQRKVSLYGYWRSPNDMLCLKLYDMHVEEPFSEKLWQDIQCDGGFLDKESYKGLITPRSGLGFAILSKSNLNIARWDDKYPIVLVNTLYDFKKDKNKILRPELLDINKFGAFCIWELGIVNHEKEAWKTYLASQRKEIDKSNYLKNTIEGVL